MKGKLSGCFSAAWSHLVLQHLDFLLVGRAPWPAADPLVGLLGPVRPTLWLLLCRLVLQDLNFLARRDYFLVGQAVRLSPPAVAGVWLLLCRLVGQPILAAAGFSAGSSKPLRRILLIACASLLPAAVAWCDLN